MQDHLEVFHSLALKRGGLWFFELSDAIKIVEALKAENVKILGLDAFIVTEEVTRPIMEDSMEFSAVSDTWKSAREFLNSKIGSNLMFEITLDD